MVLRQLRYFLLVFIFFALLSFSSSSAQATDPIRLSLDDIKSLGTTLNQDAVVKVEGSGSIRISTLWPTTICLGEVSGLNIDKTKLVY